MSSSEAASTASGSGPKTFAYRHGGNLVFVRAVDTFEAAASLVRESFPYFDSAEDERIQFTVEARLKDGTPARILVSPSAWPFVSQQLPAYEIIDVSLASATVKGYDVPPQYETHASSHMSAWKKQIVTYRYENTLIYVRLAPTAEDAAILARDTFRSLAHIPSNRIRFCLSIKVRGESGRAAVGPSAWSTITFGLARGEILDIEVEPSRSRDPSPAADAKHPLSLNTNGDEPPMYDDAGSGNAQFLDAKVRGRAEDKEGDRPRSPSVMQRAKNLFGGKKP